MKPGLWMAVGDVRAANAALKAAAMAGLAAISRGISGRGKLLLDAACKAFQAMCLLAFSVQ